MRKSKRWGFARWDFWAKCAFWLSGSALACPHSALHSAMIGLSIVIVQGNAGLGNVSTLLGFNGDGTGDIGMGGGGNELDTRIDTGSADSGPLAVETKAASRPSLRRPSQNRTFPS
ncbi:MAG: hypothetical protein U0903_02800 [Planctomycetales bacterium]